MDSNDMRKVRPIYDALDYDNNKLALQLCNKILSKKNNPLLGSLVKSLKSLALTRMGQFEEGLDLAIQVHETSPVDQPTLQSLMLTYKALGEKHRLVDLYERAFNALPRDEELAALWFMAIVRTDDLKKMQTAGMKLFKTFQDPKYYFWSVQAVYLQSLQQKETASKTMLLTLAERMMEKGHQDKKLNTVEALRLYLDILDQTGKSSKAIELLQSDLKELFKVSADHTQALAYFFHRTKQYQELSTLTSVWLCESPDDWEAIQLYVESVYHLGQDQDTSPGNALQTAHVFIQDLQKKVLQDKHPKRGPFLAETLLHKTMGDDSGVSEAIATFFERFGSRTSWFDDLKPYKSQIKDWSDILEKLDTIMKGKNENPDVSEIDRLRSYVNLKKVVRLSSSNWTRDRINQEVQELVSMYTKSLPLSKDLDEREPHHGDDLLVLAAHYSLDKRTRFNVGQPALYEALYFVELGLLDSKFNYQLKLLAIRLYYDLGVYARPVELAESMEIKQIQHDTLSHFYTDKLEVFGNTNVALTRFAYGRSIHQRNEIETPEMILQAFKFGTFSKIAEFYRFRDRLQHSIQKTIFDIQDANVHLVRYGRHLPDLLLTWPSIEETLENMLDAGEEKRKELIDRLYDNRDINVMANYVSEEPMAKLICQGQYPLYNKDWIRVQVGTLNLVSTLLNERQSDSPKGAAKDLESIVKTYCSDRIEVASLDVLVAFGKMFPVTSISQSSLQPLFDAIEVLAKSLQDISLLLSPTLLSLEKSSSICYAMNGILYAYMSGSILESMFDLVVTESKSKAKQVRAKPEYEIVKGLFDRVRNVSKRLLDALNQGMQVLKDKEGETGITEMKKVLFEGVFTDLSLEGHPRDEILMDITSHVMRSWSSSLQSYTERLTRWSE